MTVKLTIEEQYALHEDLVKHETFCYKTLLAYCPKLILASFRAASWYRGKAKLNIERAFKPLVSGKKKPTGVELAHLVTTLRVEDINRQCLTAALSSIEEGGVESAPDLESLLEAQELSNNPQLTPVLAEIRRRLTLVRGVQTKFFNAYQPYFRIYARKNRMVGRARSDDFIQIAGMYLIRALERYDAKGGANIQSYVDNWIKAARNQLGYDTPYRVPKHRVTLARNFREWVALRGSDPSEADISTWVKTQKVHGKEALNSLLTGMDCFPLATVESETGQRLDYGKNNGNVRYDESPCIVHPNLTTQPIENDPNIPLTLEDIIGQVKDPIQRDVLMLRFRDDLDLRDVAAKYQFTRQRAQQLQAAGLASLKRKLGHLSNAY